MIPLVDWEDAAREDVKEIAKRVAEDNPRAAQALTDEIFAKAATLSLFPHIYRQSRRMPGLRELVIRGYIIYYAIHPERIAVVNVVHTRRQWPR